MSVSNSIPADKIKESIHAVFGTVPLCSNGAGATSCFSFSYKHADICVYSASPETTRVLASCKDSEAGSTAYDVDGLVLILKGYKKMIERDFTSRIKYSLLERICAFFRV